MGIDLVASDSEDVQADHYAAAVQVTKILLIFP